MIKPAHTLSAVLLALSLAAPARAEDPSADTVVAVVNGTEITLGNMIAARNALPAQYQSLPDDVLFNGVLEQLTDRRAHRDDTDRTPRTKAAP